MHPIISCIMANYNTDCDMLKDSINSILCQTYKNFELIIVDDCSTDNSTELLRYFKKSDSRVKLIFNEVNKGLAFSLNRAIKLAKGKYIARMDTDDISLPNRFASQLAYMEKRPEIDVLGTYSESFGAHKGLNIIPFFNPDDCKCQLLFSNCLCHPSVMLRKAFLEDNNLIYDEQFLFSQDFDLWTRCAEKGNIAVLNKVLIKYRVHSRQVSTEKRALQIKYAMEICIRQIKKIHSLEACDIDAHMILCGFKDATYENIKRTLDWGETILFANEKMQVYSVQNLRKILYSRITNLILKSKNLKLNQKITILLKNSKLIGINTLYSIIYHLCFRVYYILLK